MHYKNLKTRLTSACSKTVNEYLFRRIIRMHLTIPFSATTTIVHYESIMVIWTSVGHLLLRQLVLVLMMMNYLVPCVSKRFGFKTQSKRWNLGMHMNCFAAVLDWPTNDTWTNRFSLIKVCVYWTSLKCLNCSEPRSLHRSKQATCLK